MERFETTILAIIKGHSKVRYRLRYVDYSVNQWTVPAYLNDVGLKNILSDNSIDGLDIILKDYSVTINDR